jgi:hypothetical protein
MLSRVRYAAPVLVLFLLLLLFSLHAGCVSPGKGTANGTGLTGETPPSGTGTIVDITSRNRPKVSLDDAMSALSAAEQDGGINIQGMTIREVDGFGVDSSGIARTWVLSMAGGGKTTLLSYSDNQWQIFDMPNITLPEAEVKIDGVISPQDLFKQNLIPIVKEMNHLKVGDCDLTLGQDTYRITIHSASESSTLTFNAKTGELMPSA